MKPISSPAPFFVTACLFLASTAPAYAYIDPGTGSYLLQIIAAVVLASIFVIKSFWKSIKEGVLRMVAKPKRLEDEK